MKRDALKVKTCSHCGGEFIPARMGQKVCFAYRCVMGNLKAEKAAAKADIKRRKEAVKTPKELIPLVQEAFNAFIRARDRDKGCFVCGKPFPVGQLGGDFDAGHVRSRGAAKHLRFNEDNCHGECKECNSSWGAKPHEIEAGAIRRIGQERYDALKNNNTQHKWTKGELLALRDEYRAKLKALKEAE